MQAEPGRSRSDREPAFPIPDRIPVVALPNVVLLPNTYLPLHIFEPRYREMITDTVAHGQCIGMSLLKEGWEDEYYNNPPIFEIGCVGRLASVQNLPDGRFNILLQGLRRYEVREQCYEKSYRQATIVLKPVESDTLLDPPVRAELLRLFRDYLRTCEDGHQWQELFRLEIPDAILVNNFCASLDCTPLEKQFLLEADSLRQRARRLIDIIQFMLQANSGVEGWG